MLKVIILLLLGSSVYANSVATKQVNDVVLKISKKRGGLFSTAFLVESKGKYYVLTAGHVCGALNELFINADTKVNVLKNSETLDLCLIKAPTNIDYGIVIETSKVPKFSKVAVIGYPSQSDTYVGESGYLSGNTLIGPHIQPGSSGSPVVNKITNLVGVVVAKNVEVERVAYIVTLSEIQSFLADIK